MIWKRPTEYFKENRRSGPRRKPTSRKQHWFQIFPLINEFNQLQNKLLGEHHNEWSYDQLKERTPTLHYQDRKKHFIHEHVLVMLEDDPKWKANTPLPRYSKKLQINESSGYNSSSWWAILRSPACFRHREKLEDIMYTCIILQYMIVEDKEDTITNQDDDKSESLFLISQRCTQDFQQYLKRNAELHDQEILHQLRLNLIMHIWRHFRVNENEDQCFYIFY